MFGILKRVFLYNEITISFIEIYDIVLLRVHGQASAKEGNFVPANWIGLKFVSNRLLQGFGASKNNKIQNGRRHDYKLITRTTLLAVKKDNI